jgi:hypothetical protein
MVGVIRFPLTCSAFWCKGVGMEATIKHNSKFPPAEFKSPKFNKSRLLFVCIDRGVSYG